MSIEIVEATEELLNAYYGERQDPRVRAFVALLDGEPIGVGGVAYRGGVLEVFSDLKPEMKRYPVTLYKTARRVLAMVDRLAFANEDTSEPTARRLLRRLGFEEQGEVWIWRR